jgi:hypothetical protein
MLRKKQSWLYQGNTVGALVLVALLAEREEVKTLTQAKEA